MDGDADVPGSGQPHNGPAGPYLEQLERQSGIGTSSTVLNPLAARPGGPHALWQGHQSQSEGSTGHLKSGPPSGQGACTIGRAAAPSPECSWHAICCSLGYLAFAGSTLAVTLGGEPKHHCRQHEKVSAWAP